MTEEKANEVLSYLEDILINLIESSENDDYFGFKYLAVKKRESKNNYEQAFYLELGYRRDYIDEKFLEKIIEIIKKYLSENLTLIPLRIEQDLVSEGSDDSFEYLKTGDQIKAYATGTLGGFITLKNRNGNYLISNAHVLLGKDTAKAKLGGVVELQISDKVLKKIGEVTWGIFNEYYDVAIAKLDERVAINDEAKKIKIVSPSFQNKELIGQGMCCEEEGILYSKKALVRVGMHLHKNQILMEKNDLGSGDSGTILVEKKTNNVIGLYIGGNDKIKIANNLYDLFIKKNLTPIDSYGGNIQIQLDSFYKP